MSLINQTMIDYLSANLPTGTTIEDPAAMRTEKAIFNR